MKTIVKFGLTAIFPALVALVLSFTGCNVISGDSLANKKKGEMNIRMTDAPALYTEVNVDIRSVEVHYENENDSDSEWVELYTNSGIYNLLDLQDTVNVQIANSTELSTGKITQIRLILGTENSVTLLSGAVVGLELSSQANTGLKLNLNAEIKSNTKTDVLLDFDAEKSIVEVDGILKLKPVIKIENVHESEK